jgi:hypothetical protein
VPPAPAERLVRGRRERRQVAHLSALEDLALIVEVEVHIGRFQRVFDAG